MNAENFKDQRHDQRYEILDYAMLSRDGESAPVRCVVIDIGLGGLQVRSRVNLPKGAICLMNIGNLEDAPIQIRGEVRHSKKVDGSDLHAAGIKFLAETSNERATIAAFVHSAFQRRADHLTP